MRIFTLCIVSILIFIQGWEVNANWNQEFPNYFLEMVSRQDSGTLSTQEAEQAVENAVFSILSRIRIPYLENKRPGTVGFFKKLEEKAQRIDPQVRVYVAGGVVRSLLGYTYQKVFKAKIKNPQLSTAEILARIAHSDKELLSLKALGIGSDLDILFVPSSNDEKKDEEIKKELHQFVNSVKDSFGLTHLTSKLGFSIIPIADVKNYQKQISRTIIEGGSTLDWLAFPVSGGHMKQPGKYPDILKGFILGYYNYIDGEDRPDADSTTVRALRPMLEIPYLILPFDDEQRLTKDLKVLVEKIQSGKEISPKAIEQFSKMTRNARVEGAHNRFYRLPGAVEKMTLALSEAYVSAGGSEKKRMSLIPEFLINQDIRKRKVRNHPIDHLLTDVKTFYSKYSQGGRLYHGSPMMDNILCIIRNGFILSSETQGRAVYGDGAYCTGNRNTASQYGIPFEFRLKEDAQPRILEWKKVKNEKIIQEIIEAAKKENLHPFRYFAQNFDIDLITDLENENGISPKAEEQYVIVVNSGALVLPKKARDLIYFYAESAENGIESAKAAKGSELESALKFAHKAYHEYLIFHQLGNMFGIQNLKVVSMPKEFEITSLLKNDSLEMKKIGMAITLDDPKRTAENEKVKKALIQTTRESDLSVVILALHTLNTLNSELEDAGITDQKIQKTLLKAKNNPKMLAAVLSVLNAEGSQKSAYSEDMKKTALDLLIAAMAITEDTDSRLMDPQGMTLALVRACSDPNRELRNIAFTHLGNIYLETDFNSPEVQLALIDLATHVDLDQRHLHVVKYRLSNMNSQDPKVLAALEKTAEIANPEMKGTLLGVLEQSRKRKEPASLPTQKESALRSFFKQFK